MGVLQRPLYEHVLAVLQQYLEHVDFIVYVHELRHHCYNVTYEPGCVCSNNTLTHIVTFFVDFVVMFDMQVISDRFNLNHERFQIIFA